MIVLDTDHMVVLKYADGQAYATLSARMDASQDQLFATTCLTVEEQMRGWLALVKRTRDLGRQVSAYQELNRLIDFFACWTRLDFDDEAADEYEQLRRQKIRIGTMDMKIAAIALRHNATLLSANLRDFRQVPDLIVEDWLH